MKKLIKITTRHCSKSNSCRLHFEKEIARSLGCKSNSSAVNRAIYESLDKNKKLKALMIKEVLKLLKEANQ